MINTIPSPQPVPLSMPGAVMISAPFVLMLLWLMAYAYQANKKGMSGLEMAIKDIKKKTR